MSSNIPHIGPSNSGRNDCDDVLWNYWMSLRRGEPDGQVWERNCVEAVKKIKACRGYKPTTIFPAGDWGTASDVIDADNFSFKQRGGKRRRLRWRQR